MELVRIIEPKPKKRVWDLSLGLQALTTLEEQKEILTVLNGVIIP